jgi:UDP-N-acetylglucosamine--dolichyl-phosphate N-acetylglucosaminephosphotransferase
MDKLLILAVIISFLITILIMPFWIRKAKQIGLIWEDMHKVGHPQNVAGSGGVIVVLGFMMGVLIYVAARVFSFNSFGNVVEILAILCCVLFMALIAFVDDLFGWHKGGLSIRSRLILTAFAAIPLMVINAGSSTLLGINLGILYPLVIIPIAVTGATTTYNFLAGYNGLEAGQGIIMLGALSIVTYLTGNAWLSVVALCMCAALAAFYLFNKKPAKVFPGNVLTYSVGALIAAIAVIGNIEKIALFFFIPYILETILKSRGRLKKQSFGKLNEDGSLEVPYDKIYGLEHLAIWILKKVKPNKKVYENEVTWLIHSFTIIIILIGFLIFFY